MDVPAGGSLRSLVREHEESGRPYPRPRSTCDDCQGEIVLRYGDKVRPHWAHLKGSNRTDSHKPNGESGEHKLAKDLLVSYLSNGGKCRFVHACDDSILRIPEIVVKFEQEVKFLKSQFDVAGLNAQGEAIFDIEVLFTHKTTNVSDRNTICWVEVDACDVIEKLDKEPQPASIVLRDEGTKPCCNHLVAKGLSKLDIKISRILAERLCYRRVTNVVIYRYWQAMKGKAFWGIRWSTEGKTCNCRRKSCLICSAWVELLKFQQCLMCLKHHETKYCRPYCKKCYIAGCREMENPLLEIGCGSDVQRKYREMFKWVGTVPNVKGDECDPYLKGNECLFCDDSCVKKRDGSEDDGFMQHVWYFGKKKRLCSDCLTSEYHRRLKSDK